MIHVLHLCSDYSRQKLYKELFLSLAQMGIRQTIYVPVRTAAEVGKYDIPNVPDTVVIYAHILEPKHRILYKSKINTIYEDVLSKVEIKGIDIIHAHFLFSDGGVALKLKQQFSIPYITAVRNTDVNMFFKYMIHLRGHGQNILSNARQCIFVTPSYRKQVADKYIAGQLKERILNATVIPNGLTPDWFENQESRPVPHNPLRILYVGDFTFNKNILLLLSVIKALSGERPVTLTLAGGGGDGHESVLKALKQEDFSFVKFVGKVEGATAMRALYGEHDIFVMISKLETFGLVYLEALSQGLPVIHTAGQGIDGYFEKSSFAIPVQPNNMNESIEAIKKIADNFETASREAVQAVAPFSWTQIAKTYLNLYLEKPSI